MYADNHQNDKPAIPEAAYRSEGQGKPANGYRQDKGGKIPPFCPPSHLLDTDLAAFDGGEELLCLRIVRVGAGVLFQHFDGFVAFVLGE